MELMTTRQVCELLQCSRITLWRLIRKGQFPQPAKLTERANRWTRAEVEEFINTRIRGIGQGVRYA